MEFFNLFPVTCAAMLPDQLTQSTSGIRELIRVNERCAAIQQAIRDELDEQAVA